MGRLASLVYYMISKLKINEKKTKTENGKHKRNVKNSQRVGESSLVGKYRMEGFVE